LQRLAALFQQSLALARTFLEKMTRIYRYILKSSNNELVRLSDEINFAATYINLQETRFQDGLKVNIDISEDDESYKIVPVTIQNMIENAIKHNIISTKTPLTINITVEDGYLVIQNNLQKKARVETSNKLGLTQLKTLYQYLSDKPVIIEETEEDFTIKIPLV
jgi:LytS/YehU family sensor histidine kinase